MATLGTVSIGTAPTLYYDGWWSATRIDNTTMRYVFEFNARFRTDNYGGFLGYGYELLARVLVQNGSASKYSDWIRIKNQDYDCWGPNEADGKTLSNFKFTVDFPSSQAGENASVTLIIDEGDSRANDNTSVGSATVGTVTSSALLYTAVKNPTSISVTGLKNGIAAPGQILTFQWSGAQAGVNNEIDGYSFGCTTNAKPPSVINPNLITEPEITGNSTTWTTPGTRGTTYYFFIKTRGKIDGLDSMWERLSETCLVNNLPLKPDSTVSTQKVANAGGQVSFGLTTGKDNDPNQNLSLYYTINTDTEKIPTTSNFSYKVTETTKFNFFTFDGLEYSADSASVVVSVNKIPVISDVVDNSDKSYARTVTVTARDDDDANNQLSYIYELWRGNSKLHTSDLISDSQYSVGDIRDFIESAWSIETTFEWRVTAFDGYDYSESKSSSFNIFGCPTVEAIYNQHAFKKVENSNEEHFSNNARIELNIPQGVVMGEKPQYTGLQLKVNGITYPSTGTMNTIGIDEGRYFTDFSGLKANTRTGERYIFEVTIIGSNNKAWVISNNIQLTRAPQFSLSSLSANAISPFTLESTGNYAVVAFANNNKTKDELDTAYSLQESGFKYYWTINSAKGDTKDIQVDFTSTNATIILKQSGLNLFDSLPSTTKIPWNRDYVGNQSQITVEVTNVFGDTVSASVNCPVYFVQSATSNKANPQLYIGTDDSSTKTWFNSSKHFLQENVHLYGDDTFIIQDYFGCQSAQLEINRNEQGWQYLNAITLTEMGKAYQLGKPIECALAVNSLYQVKTITSAASYNCQFRIAFINKAGRTSYFYFTNNNSNQYLVLPHKPAVVSIESATYANNTVSFTAKITYGFGAGSPTNLTRDLSYSAKFGDEEKSWSDSSLPALLTKQFKPNTTGWTWQNLTLTITTTQTLKLNEAGDTVVSEAPAESNTVIVYNILPTVAYRLNHVGINTNNFSDNEIFVVGATSGRNIVKFKGVNADTGEAIAIDFDLTTGQISGASIDFDLTTGQISGANIDCGAWE